MGKRKTGSKKVIDIGPYISLVHSADSQLARRIYGVLLEADKPLRIDEIRDKIGEMPGSFRCGSYNANALDLLIQVGLVEEILKNRERKFQAKR